MIQITLNTVNKVSNVSSKKRMNTFDYKELELYRNEELAVKAYKEFRVIEGIICKKCKWHKHYWLEPKQQFQCAACRFRTTLRSGTVLKGGKLPIYYFFIAMHLLLKKGDNLTVDEFQEYINHRYYEPMWDLFIKVKKYLKDNNKDEISTIFYKVVDTYFIRKNDESIQ
jgi:hypothetical protein